MDKNRIFKGNLMRDNLLIGTATFLKIGEEYVFLEDIKKLIDILKVKTNNYKLPKLGTINNGDFYIDEDSLTPFYETSGHKSLKKIRSDYILATGKQKR